MTDDSTKNTRPWLLPSREKNMQFPAGLYVVSTPIGNMGDITLRALDTLAAADIILCEDTRVTRKLLTYYGINGKTCMAYNDHNADAQRPKIIEKIRDGAHIALVSDAGTPLVSDPGYKLVRDCTAQSLYVTSLPGANAPLTALQLSAMPSDAFCFIGFLPNKKEARRTVLRTWQAADAPVIIFENPRRIIDTLGDVLDVWGDRPAATVREMTKLFEETRRGCVSELIDYYNTHETPKGEMVLVIGAGTVQEITADDVDAMLRDALKTMGTKEASEHVADTTGQSKKSLYNRALNLS